MGFVKIRYKPDEVGITWGMVKEDVGDIRLDHEVGQAKVVVQQSLMAYISNFLNTKKEDTLF